MEQNRPIAWHVPNLLNICIDSTSEGEMSGKIYHCYRKEPIEFQNIVRMIEIAEDLFDRLQFPQAATQSRSFKTSDRENGSLRQETKPEKVVDQEQILHRRGKTGTFLLNVKYRQNSSWQGVIQWVEEDVTWHFVSVLELIKILNNALN